jgi:prevent-host-death family protein
MKLHNQVKPLSHFKANAPKILQDLAETGNPMVITVNGEAVAILQDVRSYQETQETMALLRVLAMGEKEVREGKFSPAREAMTRVRAKLKR